MSLFEKKNQTVASIDECIGNAVSQNIIHLHTTTDTYDGRSIVIHDHKEVVNFGSCSYLGLEMDERLKEGGIDAIRKYGSQFSSSRAFLSCGLYTELEHLVSQIFDAHAIVAASTTLGHLSSIPTLVGDNDAVIIDHQVHSSVRTAVELLKPRGVHVEMIRHNRVDILEERIKALRDKHYRVWYMADGVYSMYGDYAPIHELYALMDKYDMLHLYIDDAHGMSWTGPKGGGYIMSQVKLRSKVYLVTSLNKAFAAGGAALIFTSRTDMQKVRTVGSSFVFSGPMQPAMLGTAIASAKIHLSDEIYSLQDELKQRLTYCDQLIRDMQLPYVYSSGSPIFYIGLGIPAMAYNIVKQLIDKGFYVDMGTFPAVRLKCSGLRLAINNNVHLEDIKNVINAIGECYPKALLEERQTIEEISKHFKMDFSYARYLNPEKKETIQPLTLNHYTTIKNVDKTLWDGLLGDRGSFDWEGCLFLEDVFHDNPEPENNWNFHYYVIFDNGLPVLVTFVTELISKDDMLSPASVSQKIEKERKLNPYYLTSKVMMMGSLLTEGEHLYLNKTSKRWKQAIDLFITEVQQEQETAGASAIYLRDISTDDTELATYLLNKGFVKNDMPDSWVVDSLDWKTEDEYINQLSSNSRAKLRKNVLRHQSKFTVTHDKLPSEILVQHWKTLYDNVKGKNLHLNTFPLPEKIFRKIAEHQNWEILNLAIQENENKPTSVIFAYKTKHHYIPVFLGLNYDYNTMYNVYRQSLYQTVKRANVLQSKRVLLGMESGIEKKALGAKSIKRSVFVQLNDTYEVSVLQSYNYNHKS